MKTTWRDSWKVAQWEVKRNITNKSFLNLHDYNAGHLSPVCICTGIDCRTGSKEPYTLYVKDELGVYEALSESVAAVDSGIVLEAFSGSMKALEAEIKENDEKGYVVLDESVGITPFCRQTGTRPLYRHFCRCLSGRYLACDTAGGENFPRRHVTVR